MTKTRRNDPCPCGSGKKYKKCCERATKQAAAGEARIERERRQTLEKQQAVAEKSFRALLGFRQELRERYPDDAGKRLNAMKEHIEANTLDGIWASMLVEDICDASFEDRSLLAEGWKALDLLEARHAKICVLGDVAADIAAARGRLAVMLPDKDLPPILCALLKVHAGIVDFIKICSMALYHDRVAGVADALAEIYPSLPEDEKDELEFWGLAFRLAESLASGQAKKDKELQPFLSEHNRPWAEQWSAVLSGEGDKFGLFGFQSASKQEKLRALGGMVDAFVVSQHGRLSAGRCVTASSALGVFVKALNRGLHVESSTRTNKAFDWLPNREELGILFFKIEVFSPYEHSALSQALPWWVDHLVSKGLVSPKDAGRFYKIFLDFLEDEVLGFAEGERDVFLLDDLNRLVVTLAGDWHGK